MKLVKAISHVLLLAAIVASDVSLLFITFQS